MPTSASYFYGNMSIVNVLFEVKQRKFVPRVNDLCINLTFYYT